MTHSCPTLRSSDLKRMQSLDDYDRAAGCKPTVEGALHAFLDTDLDLYIQGGEGWKNYGAFGAQASNSPEGAEFMDKYFDPVVLRLIEILKKAGRKSTRLNSSH